MKEHLDAIRGRRVKTTSKQKRSKFNGVSWNKAKRQWIAKIGTRYLGSFVDDTAAAAAYQAAEKAKIRGELKQHLAEVAQTRISRRQLSRRSKSTQKKTKVQIKSNGRQFYLGCHYKKEGARILSLAKEKRSQGQEELEQYVREVRENMKWGNKPPAKSKRQKT